MARKKSNRWIRIDVGEVGYPKYIYFKTLQEVADFYGFPNKQYVSDIMHERRYAWGRLDYWDIKYVNVDLTAEQIETSNQLKAIKQPEIQQHIERK